jgi:hypothetical protein
MSTTEDHGSIRGTAVQAAPGLWRTNLQILPIEHPVWRLCRLVP